MWPTVNFNEIKNINLPGLLLWKKDLQSRYLDLNQNFAYFFGFKHFSEMIGINDYKLKTPAAELADVFQQCDQQVLENDKPKQFFEVLYTVKQQLRTIFVTKAPVINETGFIATFGHAQDITESFSRLGPLLACHYPERERKKSRMQSFQLQKKLDSIHLTTRQEECLFFLLRHKTAKQIAQILKISVRTTEDHIEQLKFKFLCQNKNELMEKALYLGYFNFIPPTLFNRQLSVALETAS